MKWCVLGVALVVQVVWAQAPIERRSPPPPPGAQAPKDEDTVQDVPAAKPQQGGASGSSGAAGSPQGGFPTIKVETRLVNVALNVMDGNGSPVGGLGRAKAGPRREAVADVAVYAKAGTWALRLGEFFTKKDVAMATNCESLVQTSEAFLSLPRCCLTSVRVRLPAWASSRSRSAGPEQPRYSRAPLANSYRSDGIARFDARRIAIGLASTARFDERA